MTTSSKSTRSSSKMPSIPFAVAAIASVATLTFMSVYFWHENAIEAARDSTIQVVLVCVLFSAAYVFSRRRAGKPLGELTDKLVLVCEDNLDFDVPFLDRKDAVGDMARALDMLRKTSLQARDARAHLIKTEEDAERRAQHHRDEDARAEKTRLEAEHRQVTETQVRKAVRALADQVETQLNINIRGIVEQTNSLSESANKMADNAANVTDNASDASSNANEALGSAQTVASAAEELFASIKEISRQVSHSTDLTKKTVRTASETRNTVADLERAAKDIQQVVALISDIAEQTNLLALNATIESARAGEAGKGFAVVAGEVKNLANQTAKSTQDISERVTNMQTVVTQAVGAIDAINEQIGEVGSVSEDIAGAIEQQSGATEEIARSVNGASTAVSAVVDRIQDVSNEAANSAGLAKTVEVASKSLFETTNDMRAKLIGMVRTAAPAANRREQERSGTNIKCGFVSQLSGKEVPAVLTDISVGGCRVRPDSEINSPEGAAITIKITEFNARLNGKIIENTPKYIRIQFDEDQADLVGDIARTSGNTAAQAA